MSSFFFGGSVVAAWVAGMVSLFAPCCISVMLPAYLAGTLQNRRLLVAMTFLFGAGVATIVLPIALGAQFLRRTLVQDHATIYIGGGLIMVALAVFTLCGGRLRLPMPGRRPTGRTGPLGVYSLGVFSGVATSCCAPVLAAVVTLSGAASSFVVALGLGLAYVLGMVMPLFLVSWLWERRDWQRSRLFRPRSLTWRVGPLSRTLSASAVASGMLLGVMGGWAIWMGAAGQSMPTPSGWQAWLAARIGHVGHVVADALSWVPGWAAAGMLLLAVAALARIAFRQLGWSEPNRVATTEAADSLTEEKAVEHSNP